jgi:hypothetical protein
VEALGDPTERLDLPDSSGVVDTTTASSLFLGRMHDCKLLLLACACHLTTTGRDMLAGGQQLKLNGLYVFFREHRVL